MFRLQEELEVYHRAALAARAEATDEQSKAENKYDTRGLEASYLARGQSKQAAELEQAIEQLQKLDLREFTGQDPVDLGALVELELRKERSFYFLAPRAGGTEVTLGKKEVLVITPQSPLGSQIMGKKMGERCLIDVGGSRQEYKLAAVA